MRYANFADYLGADPERPRSGLRSLQTHAEPLDRFTKAVRRAYLAGSAGGPRSMAAPAWAARGIVP
jgi:hypothetical protein